MRYEQWRRWREKRLLELIYSNAWVEASNQGARKRLNQVFYKALAREKGDKCIWAGDSRRGACGKRNGDPITHPLQLEWHHSLLQCATLYIKDYQHAADPVRRRENIRNTKYEALTRCVLMCGRHHMQLHNEEGDEDEHTIIDKDLVEHFRFSQNED